MNGTRFFIKTIFGTFMFLIFAHQLFAKLPDQYEIPNFAIDSIRLDIATIFKYDYNSTRIYHPFFTASINAILSYYQAAYQLAKHENRMQDTTADYYLNTLKQHRVTIYKMNNLQGKVLRAMINGNIPVLLIGKNRNNDYRMIRLHGDVIYSYHRPFATSQSNKQLAEEKLSVFKTARGYGLESEEIGQPANQESDEFRRKIASLNIPSPIEKELEKLKLEINGLKQKNQQKSLMEPFSSFDYYCVVTSPAMPLPAIKDLINKNLSDVGFEYKLPEFEEMNGKNLTW